MNENGYLVYIMVEGTPQVHVFRPAALKDYLQHMDFDGIRPSPGHSARLRSAVTPDLVYNEEAKIPPGFYYLEWVE